EYAAHLRGRKEHVIGSFGRKKVSYRLLAAQIQLVRCAQQQVVETQCLQLPANGRPYHAPVPGNVYHFTFVHIATDLRYKGKTIFPLLLYLLRTLACGGKKTL